MRLKPGLRWIALAIVVAVAAVATWYFLTIGSAEAAEYLTARVERGDVSKTVSATGTLQAVTTVQVGSQVSGTIAALSADFNSSVRKGQVIAQIDPATFQAQVASAQAALEQARADLANAQARLLAAEAVVESQRAGVSSAGANLAALEAQRDDALSVLKRQESLAESGVITARDIEAARASFKAAEARYTQALALVDQARVGERSATRAGLAEARATVQQTQARVRQAEAALRLAEANLAYTTIHSPIDGVVVSRNVDVGQTVAASLSAPTIFTIANDLAQMRVIANIDQADIGVIDPNVRVTFTVDAFPGRRFEGTINQIRLSPQNVQNVITYNVVIDVQNPDLKLLPGMTTNLTFTVAERKDVPRIPSAALRFTPEDENAEKSGERKRASRREAIEGSPCTVWVLGQDGRPQSREITVGITDGVSIEVTGGSLVEGETVIVGQKLSGSSSTTSGQRTPGFGGTPGGFGGGRH